MCKKILTLLLALGILSSACSKQEERNPNYVSSGSSSENTSVQLDKPKVEEETPEKAPMEDLDDPTLWSTPRLEFISFIDEDKNGRTESARFSFDLKGKNIRKIVNTFGEIMNNGEFNASSRLYRSPNNRYLAGNFYGMGTDNFAGLFDLKTKELIRMGEAHGKIGLAWALDSSYVLYSGFGGVFKYTLNTRTSERLTKDGKKQIFALQDGNFVAVDYPGFIFYDEKFNELARIKADGAYGEYFNDNIHAFRLSPSSRYIVASGPKDCIYDLTRPYPDNKIICERFTGGEHISFYNDTSIAANFKKNLIVKNFLDGSIIKISFRNTPYTTDIYDLINVDKTQYPLPKFPYVK